MITLSLWSKAQPTISLGILTDFDTKDSISVYINNQIVNEIKKVIGMDYVVLSDSSMIRTCRWNSDVAKKEHALLSQTADLIVLIGPHSLQGSLKNQPFAKKNIALGVFSNVLQAIPATPKGTSGIKNFSYIASSSHIMAELKQFKKEVDFEHLGIIIDSKTSSTLNKQVLGQYLSNMRDSLNVKITTHYFDSEQLNSSLAELPRTIDAVFAGIPYEWNAQTADTVFKELIKRQIPSLVMNDNYLYTGALMSYSKNTSLAFITKRLAIMLGDALDGDSLAHMSIYVNKKKETSINLQTAKAIQYSPQFKTLFTANIIQPSVDDKIPQFSIQSLIKKALEENLDISVAKKDISISENDIAQARSQFLPNLDANANGILIDKNRPNPLVGQAEQTVTVGGKLTQLIYSESTIAKISIQKHLLKAQKYATDQEILAQLLSVFNAYFSVLQAKTFLAIQIENFIATKQNLELAKKRNSIGTTNQSDVYRWQSELANGKQQIIEANTQLYALKYQLNTLLNNSLPEEFDITDATVQDESFAFFSNSDLEKAIDTPTSLAKLTSFLSQEAVNHYPAKNQLLANIDALERQQVMNKRLYYTPVVALQGQVNQNLYRGGAGSTPLPQFDFINQTWDLGLSVSYPIFQGNRRKLNLSRNQVALEQLNDQSTNLSQNITLQVKISTLNILTSKTNIENSKIAQDNADKNFLLVQQNYQLGTINITQLIDAQKNLFAVKQAYSVAVYDYLLNFIKLENNLGFYSMLATEEEKVNFRNRYLTFISNN